MQAKHQWSDRVKTVEKPLLKAYVFVRAAEDQRTDIRLTEGVINFVYRNGKLVILKESIIRDIRHFQQTYPHVTVLELPTQAGEVSSLVSEKRQKSTSSTLWIETLNLALVGFSETA